MLPGGFAPRFLAQKRKTPLISEVNVDPREIK
jgi:hypothetical protein